MGFGSFLGSVGTALSGAVSLTSPSSASQAFGTYMDYKSQQETNRQNKDIAWDQMRFQQDMSSTAHQREVDDLRKAGLNPILSAKSGGASTPSGASAQMIAPKVGEGISRAVTSAMEVQRLKKDLELADTQKKLNETQEANLQAVKDANIANAKVADLTAQKELLSMPNFLKGLDNESKDMNYKGKVLDIDNEFFKTNYILDKLRSTSGLLDSAKNIFNQFKKGKKDNKSIPAPDKYNTGNHHNQGGYYGY